MSTFRSEQLRQPLSLSGSFTGSLQGTASFATTASYALFAANGGGSTNTGSLLATASVSSNIITFTKGDTSQFSITVATGSGGSSSPTSFIATGSVTASVNTGNDTFKLTSGSSTFVYVNNSGSIGLGNVPTYSLDINLGNNKSVRLQSGATGINSFLGAAFSNTLLSNNVYYNGTNWIYEKTGPASILQLSSEGSINISNYASLISGSTLPSATGIITLANNGLVGISNTSPSHNLDVNGTFNVNSAIYLNNSSGNTGEVLTSQGGSPPIWATASFNPGYTQLLQIFSQTGNSAPTVDYEPINTTGDTYTWDYLNPGEYRLNSVSSTPFTAGKTSVILSPGYTNGTFASGNEYIFHYEILNDTKIKICVQKIGDGGGIDNIFSQATLDIKIFP